MQAGHRHNYQIGIISRNPLPTSEDFNDAHITDDATYRNLDVSSIVPLEAKAILVTGWCTSANVGKNFFFGYPDSSSVYFAGVQGRIQVANQAFRFNGVIPVNNATLGYFVENVMTDISLTIWGWVY